MIYLLAVLAILIMAFLIFLYSGIQLPKDTMQLIEEVRSEPIPDLVPEQTGYAKSGDISIFYNHISNEQTTKGTVLFVNGYSSTMLDWQPYIFEKMLEAGYAVIRYDNRGLGMSDWLDNWDKKKPYLLKDMANDGIAILDKLGIEKAHVVGMSMGGMIGQTMAIEHPNRVASLTSIMSSGYYHDPILTAVPTGFKLNFLRLLLRYTIIRNETNALKAHLLAWKLLKGVGYPLDKKNILKKALYELRKRKGYNIKVGQQHEAAIVKSGSRYEQLRQITAPTLVIHGKADPLILFEHAEKYAPMIPNAQTLFIESMGHDMPRVHNDEICGAMVRLFNC